MEQPMRVATSYDPSPEEIAIQRAAFQRMIPVVEGRPGVLVQPFNGTIQIFVAGRVGQLRVEVDSVWWVNEWLDRNDSWPDEVTDEFAISDGCLVVTTGWWYDSYFGCWFVIDPTMAEKSLAGDDSWVGPYLGLDEATYGRTRRCSRPGPHVGFLGFIVARRPRLLSGVVRPDWRYGA